LFFYDSWNNISCVTCHLDWSPCKKSFSFRWRRSSVRKCGRKMCLLETARRSDRHSALPWSLWFWDFPFPIRLLFFRLRWSLDRSLPLWPKHILGCGHTIVGRKDVNQPIFVPDPQLCPWRSKSSCGALSSCCRRLFSGCLIPRVNLWKWFGKWSRRSIASFSTLFCTLDAFHSSPPISSISAHSFISLEHFLHSLPLITAFTSSFVASSTGWLEYRDCGTLDVESQNTLASHWCRESWKHLMTFLLQSYS